MFDPTAQGQLAGTERQLAGTQFVEVCGWRLVSFAVKTKPTSLAHEASLSELQFLGGS